MKSIDEQIKAFGAMKVLDFVDRDLDHNAPKLLDWLISHDKEAVLTDDAETIRVILKDPNNNWYKLLHSFWTEIDKGQRRKIIEAMLVNGRIIGSDRQHKAQKEYQCNVPWSILMDPTSACNLHCKGCWAADYGNKMNLTYDELDNIVRQGRELGVFWYVLSGGEPLMRKNDVIKLCKTHNDCAFLSFTNGTLIDDKFGDEMLRVKNFIPAISIEGFENATDFRRGEGTFQRVTNAMKILKERHLLFGISCCYTSKNAEIIGSEAYFDSMIDMGAKFAWLFTYMPIGIDAIPELMASAEQREFMYHQIRAFRKTKPLFTMDFWNDGEFANGCIAGGRSYLHINANGDIEPCAFIHYSDTNIREHTLLEALQRPLFMQYHHNQPFNSNMLRPCPLLDNFGKLAEMVDKSGAHSTDLANPEDVHSLCEKCKNASEYWTPSANRLWSERIQE